jgi:hypothetical protein
MTADPGAALFTPMVPAERLNAHFKRLRDDPSQEPARLMMDEVFQGFEDPDGNFREQFQTTGFDSRIFELYVFAYLSRSGFDVRRDQGSPDFMATQGGLTVGIEATTVGPTATANQASPGHASASPTLTPEQLREKLENELPIKFGSPLFSKLRRQYWTLDHCKGRPLIFAIEAFHENRSLRYTSSSLSTYLYGLKQLATWTEDGQLVPQVEHVGSHTSGAKVIPSNFFGQPEARHVSAVMFTNSGTVPKFGRMGYQAGYHRGRVSMKRVGTCYDHDPNSATPVEFSYDVEEPPTPETWGQGLEILHNPNALHPIPLDFFPEAAQLYMKDGAIASLTPAFHPFNSTTMVLSVNDNGLLPVGEAGRKVGTILRREFDSLVPPRPEVAGMFGREVEWFADEGRVLVGIVIRDKPDRDWSWVLLGRDEKGVFRAIENEVSLDGRQKARQRLVARLKANLRSGKEIFPQGD